MEKEIKELLTKYGVDNPELAKDLYNLLLDLPSDEKFIDALELARDKMNTKRGLQKGLHTLR